MGTHGYIAFLDLLGFSRLVAEDDFLERWERFLGIVGEAIRDNDPSPELTIASDSMILTAGGDAGDLRALLSTIARITFISLVDLGLAIRGGVAFGFYERRTTESDGVLVAGPGVIAAYSLEHQQDWVGVMLAPAVMQRDAELQAKFSLKPFVNQEEARRRRDRGDREWIMLAHRYRMIPLHDSDPMDGYVVVPHSDASVADHAAVRDELIKYGAALVGLKPLTSEVAAQKKYEQANMFIDHVRYQFTRFNEMLYTSDFFHD